MLAANDQPGADEIRFAIPGEGPHTIAAASSLPGLRDTTLIDGYSQPGAVRNTATHGTNAVIMIELKGPSAGSTSGITLLSGSDGSVVTGLSIHGFTTLFNITPGGEDCIIAGNFIGTSPDGVTRQPGQATAVNAAADRCRIGGAAPADRNIIASTGLDALRAVGNEVIVQGNLIGTDRHGTASLANHRCGVVLGVVHAALEPDHGIRIGGRAGIDGETPGNVISGNRDCGIRIVNGSHHVIEGNLIGLDAHGAAALPNTGPGIHVVGGWDIVIGDPGATSGNLIAHNTGPGIVLSGPADDTAHPQGISMLGNVIRDNGGRSIDLAVDGVPGPTPPDTLDLDAGPNGLQNHPVLSLVRFDGGVAQVSGDLHAAADRSFDIDLYHAPQCSAQSGAHAVDHVGAVRVTSDGEGNAAFVLDVPAPPLDGYLTVTATDADSMATSELSPCLAIGEHIFESGFDDRLQG